MDPHPRIRQGNNVDCGVYVIACGIQLLHGIPIDAIEPAVWRRGLSWLPAYCTRLACDFVRIDEDRTASEATGKDKLDVLLAIAVAGKLHAGIEAAATALKQCAIIARAARNQYEALIERKIARDAIMRSRSWYSSMPDSVDESVKQAVNQHLITSQISLSLIPWTDDLTIKRLELVHKQCETDAAHYRMKARSLMSRRSELLIKTRVKHGELQDKLDELCGRKTEETDILGLQEDDSSLYDYY